MLSLNLGLAFPLLLLYNLLLAQLLSLLAPLALLLNLLARLFLAFLLDPAACHRLITITLSLDLPVHIILKLKFDTVWELNVQEGRLVDI